MDAREEVRELRAELDDARHGLADAEAQIERLRKVAVATDYWMMAQGLEGQPAIEVALRALEPGDLDPKEEELRDA